MKLKTILAIAALFFPMMVVMASTPVFPQEEGVTLDYRHSGADGDVDAICTITLRNVRGDNENGHLEMVYNCFDKKGRPYFEAPNEFRMTVDRESGQTYITMDKMSKTLKVMNLIPAGDASTVRVPMTVGENLPDTKIFTTLGIFKAILTISEKKVLAVRTIRVSGQDHICYLVHERILTKTPFGTDVATADTWYAEGLGCVSQTVWDAKGRLKGRLELSGIEN